MNKFINRMIFKSQMIPLQCCGESGFFLQIVQLLYNGDKEHLHVLLVTFLTTLRSIRCFK